MNNFNKIGILLALLICPLQLWAQNATISSASAVEDPQPVGPDGNWVLLDEFSDEFEGSVDHSKWEIDVNPWGAVWSWEPHNIHQDTGYLHVRTEYAPHIRNKMQLYFKSGMLRSWKTITYGYFEARIKAAHILPGTCPAFWMLGPGPSGQSCEVDFMELRESNPINVVSTNLHTYVDTNGDGTNEWVREFRFWDSPWDPRDDFHLFGCETTPDKITWYIDGVKVHSAKNRYWHFPMRVMLSMGVRQPYRGVDKPFPEYPEGLKKYPCPETSKRDSAKFPTIMKVDYIRVWVKD